MKKLLCCLLIALSATIAFAGVTERNRQAIVPVSSGIYKAMESLYISQGLALPSTTGPWSYAEMDIMLKRINPSLLAGGEIAVYDYLVREIGADARFNPDDAFGLGIGLDINAYTYVHTNAKEYTSLDDFGGNPNFKYQKPVFSVPLETWIGSNIYGFSSFDLGASRTIGAGLDDKLFFTNMPFIPPMSIGDLDFTFPHRAIGVIGGDHWYLSIGRDRLKWGPAESGDLTVGDQLPYQDNLRLSAFSNSFKYTFSISSFIHPMNYVEKEGEFEYLADKWNQDNPREGLRMFIAHRLEWRIVNKVNMALTESIMYQSDTNHFDLLVLSPTAIFHNYYIRGNANSLLSLEIDYTPIKYLNLYAEAILDEFMLPGENGDAKDGPPSAFGAILGAKTAVPISNGMLRASLECAYTDPYLYLRDSGDRSGKEYGVNFVVNFPDILGGNLYSDYNFLGYKFGNDSIVGAATVGYEEFGKWKVDGAITYISDGCMDMHSRWRYVENGTKDDPISPTTSPNGNGSYIKDDNLEKRNAVAHHLVLDVKGEITLFDSFNIFSEVTFFNVWNYRNEKGRMSNDFQFTLGLSYSI